MTWQLHLDDQWDDPEVPFRRPDKDFVPAKSTGEAIVLIEGKGQLPSFISFDHDLGGDDNSIMLINWMINNYYSHKVPDYTVHSANPVGKENIISKMESWRKSQELP